MICDINRLSS